MNCGTRLSHRQAVPTAVREPGQAAYPQWQAAPALPQGAYSTPASFPQQRRPDWGRMAMMGLAAVGLWHVSRKARRAAVIIVFLLVFFGLPMICGFAAFALEWLARLFS